MDGLASFQTVFQSHHDDSWCDENKSSVQWGPIQLPFNGTRSHDPGVLTV